MNRVMLHSAVTIVESSGILDQLGIPQEKDNEVCQFACEFPMNRPSRQIPESVFRKAFKEMEEACLAKAREAGLTKP